MDEEVKLLLQTVDCSEGYCPTRRRNYNIDVEYVPDPTEDEPKRYVKRFMDCDHANWNPCPLKQKCPLFNKAPESKIIL